MTFKENFETRIKKVKIEILALWHAARDSRAPWVAKVLALVVTAYAFSPVDLIPDFIPLPGYSDDLVLIPARIGPGGQSDPGRGDSGVTREDYGKRTKNGQHRRRDGHYVGLVGDPLCGWQGCLSADLAERLNPILYQISIRRTP